MLENLKPYAVFHYFEDICSIPHGSGNTSAISDYCVDFAVKNGLEYNKDSLNNVLIKKPATVGYENHPAVILQGHLDMVCEKEANCDIDFTKDGLRLKVDGDLVSAEGTTLGGDDGIAVAIVLAILADNSLAHPPIEALFTVDEETGMFGAQAFDTTKLSGNTLINIDSSNDGVLTVGCAGGAKVKITIPLVKCKNTMPCYKVSLSGLLGGHSGVDIDKNRQNADVMIGRFLKTIPDCLIVSLEGGFKDNVIPNSCDCVIATDTCLGTVADEFVRDNRVSEDPGLSISICRNEKSDSAFDSRSTAKIIDFLTETPCGIMAMSRDIEGLVESSLNIGVAKTEDDAFCTVLSVRSSVGSEKQKMLDMLENTAKSYGGAYSSHGHYPAWEFRKNSRLRDVMVDVYKKMYGKAPAVETIHAGLECGLLGDKIENFDAVSIGPDMWDIHTVNERLSVSSVERVYNYVCNVIKEL